MKSEITFDRYSIFQTGGKQYQAIEGKTIAIEKVPGQAGDTLKFDDVLLRKDAEGKINVGQPFLDTAITASIVKQMRGPKIYSFMFKRRKKVRRKIGHRQPMTVIRIEKI